MTEVTKAHQREPGVDNDEATANDDYKNDDKSHWKRGTKGTLPTMYTDGSENPVEAKTGEETIINRSKSTKIFETETEKETFVNSSKSAKFFRKHTNTCAEGEYTGKLYKNC